MPAVQSPYQHPDGRIERELEVKRSRFITRIGHADSRQAAMDFIADCQRDYPDARHVCWAFVAGNPAGGAEMGCNDAGEPAGTAGKPMLSVLEHKNLGDVVAVVIRYFGGIKLGAGGLVRAYGAAVQAALDGLPLVWRRPTTNLELIFGFEHEDLVRRLAAAENAELGDPVYGQQVRLPLTLVDDRVEAFSRQLTEQSRGQIRIRQDDDRQPTDQEETGL
ncbi:YigZ family protein [Natronospira bacteriovora]|uniref:YigZ family protein n=1 Tax=Natronospira bacteriovora TaxID=3069753 RepID=A0ABU0W5S1_9GAMM|nr:YigZ family protein [Natronospira sp. AB-CW4]MDQ2069369.1 YigZ family protein [Natronospira sp. AB-CW4]